MTIDYKRWGPVAPRAVFLLVHGLGAHAGRWEAAGNFFSGKGFASYAVELRDLDRTDIPHGRQDNFRSFYNKVLALYDIAAKDNPSKKIFLIGESMGALVSFLIAADHPGLFGGLICLSPAFASRYKPGILDRIKMFIQLLFYPEKNFKLPFDSSMCTRDLEYRNKLDSDPREYRVTSFRLVFDMLLAQMRAKRVRNKIKAPVLFLLAGEDKLVDPEAAEAIFKSLAVEDKTLVEFPGMYHALSIDIGKESVFEEMLKWIEKRI